MTENPSRRAKGSFLAIDGTSVPDPTDRRPTVRILGTRGIPAAYGGFETAAENVARYLVEHGWRVVVYCQTDHVGPLYLDTWEGIERVNISASDRNWVGTAKFDWLSIAHAVRHRDLCLTFGYNTALFNVRQWLHGIPNVINMDGIEWSRKRWGRIRQALLYLNERLGCWLGTRLIADHPELETHLRSRVPDSKITLITYGAHPLPDAPTGPLEQFGLTPGQYFTLIARPNPENSILELVRAFSVEPRGMRLVVLGSFDPDRSDYHREVINSASSEVDFVGPIYDPVTVRALRFHAAGYLHGHTVGGTNPSLVEAMAAGNAIVAHDNKYNRWVAGDAALYFSDECDVAGAVERLIKDADRRTRLGANAIARWREEFTWDKVASEYEVLLRQHLVPRPHRMVRRS